MTLCHQICLVRLRIDIRRSPFASSPRHLARTCTSALRVSSLTLVWMPVPSQIDCRHGSRESSRAHVSLKKCFATILSAYPVAKAHNSAALPHLHNSIACALSCHGAVLPSRCLCTRSTAFGNVLISIKHF